jgi:hypothetical protein
VERGARDGVAGGGIVTRKYLNVAPANAGAIPRDLSISSKLFDDLP